MTQYKDRTPDTIKKEYDKYTYKGVLDLAKYLDKWMSNEHNGKSFVQLFNDMKKDGCYPNDIARSLFGHAYDWFAYGN